MLFSLFCCAELWKQLVKKKKEKNKRKEDVPRYIIMPLEINDSWQGTGDLILPAPLCSSSNIFPQVALAAIS